MYHWTCTRALVLAFQVSILVSDINDNAPEFLAESYSVQVSEGLSIGTPVLNLLAVDDDFGSNAEVVYSIASQQPALGEHMYIFLGLMPAHILNVEWSLGMRLVSSVIDCFHYANLHLHIY